MGPVVEGPPAVRVAARLQPRPGAVPLRVANHQQQGEQTGVGVVGRVDVEGEPPVLINLERRPLGAGDGLQGLKIVGQRAGLALAAIGILLVTV